ncbi:MAG TPA: sigma-70 family RNA polymerase sigma factor [Gemmataceae bacterium]|nr:sigma-70 family RNA polymerase sigma factor [Gemmataceae bacterium]
MAREPVIPGPPTTATVLLYHFCRLQLPQVVRSPADLQRHLGRTFALYRAKGNGEVSWAVYLEGLYPLDWFVACACLDGDRQAWEYLFAARANRADCLLIDALRARAMRLYPRDEEQQNSAVGEFWSHLLVADTAGSLPVLARYDGQRPLVPWLIRVFQNYHVSQLRHRAGVQALPDDDVAMPLPESGDYAWHEAFCQAAREVLRTLTDQETLILGLRLRYRMSQREVAHLLGVHEGTISRQTTALRDRCLDAITDRLTAQGWTGDDLAELVLKEMGGLLLDEPRLSADHLAALLAARGKKLS